MKTILTTAFLAMLFAPTVFAQSEFKGEKFIPNAKNESRLRKSFKICTTYELNLAQIKAHIRKNKNDKTKPIELFITLDEKVKFNLFENDIFDDGYFEVQNGVKKTKDKIEINTYAGFVGDDPANILRLFISEDRISGFFRYNNKDFVIRHLSDYELVEKGNPNKFEIVLAKSDDEISKIESNFCANLKKNGKISADNPAGYPDYTMPCVNQSSFPTCKYIKIKACSDPQFKGAILAQQKVDIILGYINQIDLLMLQKLNVRLRLAAAPICFDNSNSPFGSSNSANIGTTSTNYNQFRQQIFGNQDKDIIELYLSGKPFGSFSGAIAKTVLGQATSYSLGRNTPNIITTVSRYPNPDGTNNVSETEAYLVIAHEIGHTIGANHPFDLKGQQITDNGAEINCSPSTVMCDGEGKTADFHSYNIKEIQCYLVKYPSGLFSSNTSPGFSNNFEVKLNGSAILSTPVLINQNSKILDVSSGAYTLNNSTTFNPSDSRVFFHYKNTTSTKFEIKTAPSFTMSISASDQCNLYYRGVPFVYSPSGARIATNAFPNPSDQSLNLENIYLDNDISISETPRIKKVKIYSEHGTLLKEVETDINQRQVVVNTRAIENGLYFMQIIRTDDSTETKRIRIEHQ